MLVSLSSSGVCCGDWHGTGLALRPEGGFAHVSLADKWLICVCFLVQFSHTKPRIALDASAHKRAVYSLSYNHERYVESCAWQLCTGHFETSRLASESDLNLNRPSDDTVDSSILRRSQLLASGDASGVVKVWHLSTELTSQASNEMEQLNSLALQILSSSSV